MKRLFLSLFLALLLTASSFAAALTPAQVSALDRAYGTAWRAPLGPYQQAPAEWGSGWWYVSPFTGPEPWVKSGPKPPDTTVPAGFTAVFGPQPNIGQKHRGEWQTNLKFFKGIGTPPGFSNDEINAAIRLFEEWGLGTPIFYEGRYGWNTRFPNQAELWGFDCSVTDAITHTHEVIATYQVRLINQTGSIPSRRHPWVAPHLFGLDAVLQ